METHYANLPDRIKAAFVDTLILIAAMYAAAEIFALFEAVPTYSRIIVWACIFVLYEPLLVSGFGGTIGHGYMGLAIKKEQDPAKNINFFMALLRYIFKWFLGWLSFLTVTGDPKRKAIHDFVAGTVVLDHNDTT